MKKLKNMVVLVAIVIMISILTGCSRNGNGKAATHLGPSKTCADTVSAVLTNSEYPSGITLNWGSRVDKPAATFTGLQQINFILDGDEIMEGMFQDRALSSITLEFTGQTSGKKVSLSNSLTGKITNLGADGDYFELDGNTIQFYPHYFTVSEDVTVKATFTYKGDGVINQLVDSESAEGYFTFTVGEDTGEKFSSGLDKIKEIFDDSSENNNISNYITIRYKATGGVEGTVAQYEDEATNNPVILGDDKIAQVILYTRENSNYNITKVYVVPVGMEDQVEKMAAKNQKTYAADNCHKFKIDMSQFSGQTVTLRIEFLDGSEWNPMPDHYYGFITFQVP